MSNSKTEIRSLVERGELKKAAESALFLAKKTAAAEQANLLTVALARLAEHQNARAAGLLRHEDAMREQAQIARDTLDILDQMPDDAGAATAPKRRLLDESTFKKRIFYFLLASNLLVIGRVLYFGGTTFTSVETFKVIGLLAPVFVAAASAMLGDFLKKGSSETPFARRRFVGGPLVSAAFWIFPLHLAALLWAIEQHGRNDENFPFEKFAMCVAAIEAILGVFVWQIVRAFFKSE